MCLICCDPIDCSPPGFSGGILQARILEWISMPSSRGSSQPRDWTCVSYVFCIGRQVLYHTEGTTEGGGHDQIWIWEKSPDDNMDHKLEGIRDGDSWPMVGKTGRSGWILVEWIGFGDWLKGKGAEEEGRLEVDFWALGWGMSVWWCGALRWGRVEWGEAWGWTDCCPRELSLGHDEFECLLVNWAVRNNSLELKRKI